MKYYLIILLFVFVSCDSEPEPKPTISFTYEKKGNGVVSFRSSSSGADFLDWDFGDGKGGREENPTHEYVKNGSYNVKVKAYSGGQVAEFVSTVVVEDIEGSVVFWMQSMRDKEIEVKIAGKTAKITGFASSGIAPACGANHCATFDRLKPGAYQFDAKELYSLNPSKWRGTIIVDKKGCIAQKLTY